MFSEVSEIFSGGGGVGIISVVLKLSLFSGIKKILGGGGRLIFFQRLKVFSGD